MNKLFQFIEENAFQIVISAIMLWIVYFAAVYAVNIQNDVLNVQRLIIAQTELQETLNEITTNNVVIALDNIASEMKYLNGSQQFLIDQNRENATKINNVVSETKKPTYVELKSHSVYIVGCSDKVLSDEDKIQYLLGEDGGCWVGTGSVIKITDTDTYILTNNHVAGFGEPNVTLYIQNEQSKVKAEVVKNHPYADMAVLKIKGTLDGKTAITKIASVNIQDKVYVVGNPLRNKMTYSEGVVANFIDRDMLLQMPLIFGNSGSGIFNANGDLVGLCYALQMYPGFLGMPMAQITHSICVDSVTIKAFLTDLGLYNE